MDKRWVMLSRSSLSYQNGVKAFIKFGLEKASVNGKIYCPCKNCYNRYTKTPELVEEHLICDGFMRGYGQQIWLFHGERDVDMELEPDTLGANYNRIRTSFVREGLDVQHTEEFTSSMNTWADCHENVESFVSENGTEGIDLLSDLLGDSDDPLFPGCTNFTTMSFVLRIYHIKALAGGSSSKMLTLILELIKEAFPQCKSLPSSYSEAKKIIRKLDLGYKKIHACPNDCTLYWGNDKDRESCQTCGASRWAVSKEENTEDPFHSDIP